MFRSRSRGRHRGIPQTKAHHWEKASLRDRALLLGAPAAARSILVSLRPHHYCVRRSVPMMHFYPELVSGLLFCACSVAISRVLLGLHFLSDVLAGAAIGMLLGFSSYAV